MAAFQQFHNGPADGASERVATEGAAVLTRLQNPQHIMISNDGRQRQDASTQRLTQQIDIGRDVLVLQSERASGTPQPGLDLISHKQRPMLAGQLTHASQIAGRRDPYARLPLDRFQQDCDDIVGDRVAERFKITVRDRDEAWSVRPVMIMCQWIV